MSSSESYVVVGYQLCEEEYMRLRALLQGSEDLDCLFFQHRQRREPQFVYVFGRKVLSSGHPGEDSDSDRLDLHLLDLIHQMLGPVDSAITRNRVQKEADHPSLFLFHLHTED